MQALTRLVSLSLIIITSFVMVLVTPFTTNAQALQLADSDNSQWISNSPYPSVVAGQQFSLQFTFENDGTNAWSDAGGYALACDTFNHIPDVQGNGPINDCLGGSKIGFNGQIVMPGQQFTFTVTVTAPNSPDGLSSETYDTWYDMEHNNSIFGNNNVYVQVTVMPNYDAEAIGTVEVVQSGGAQLYDVNGSALPTRVCPNGTLASTYVSTTWDVVRLTGLSSTILFSVPEYQSGSGDYVLVASPDPCQSRLDFSDNQSINSGTGAVGYVNLNALETAGSVLPVISNALWQNCWTPLQCSNSSSFNGLTNGIAQGGVTGYGDGPNNGIPFVGAWVATGGTSVDPHWWGVYNDAGNPAAVYGRDWSAKV